ncbi:MAG: 2-C-methyl-D-erythritol 4-phosphate cytidylyltransferase [Lachnospiraceae bacterium]|nr:2-C-methyl-D-erythritol 4-phosphate cytidylyltransferase [Lachnospiraceae bacterium]
MGKKKFAVIVLSAGRGTRMQANVPKQYLSLAGKPVLYYALDAFEKSKAEEIILVSGKEEVDYCQNEIVNKYGFTKVRAVVPGGKERYHSVFCGLLQLKKMGRQPDYVMIHDGARPFVDQATIERCAQTAVKDQACVAGMPVKDTIKIVDREQFSIETPQRSQVWQIQTPQVFAFSLIYQAYQELLQREEQGHIISVTDDAMVVEQILKTKVRLVEGSYKNIKITTPEDLEMAQIFLKNNV